MNIPDIGGHPALVLLVATAALASPCPQQIEGNVQNITIPGTLPSQNDIISAAKKHWSAYAELKKIHTDSIAVLARAARLKPVQGRVVVRVWWWERNARRDPDGVQAGFKFILDGLVQAGVLQDDARKQVQGLESCFPAPDRKRPRIEVEIIEVDICSTPVVSWATEAYAGLCTGRAYPA